MAKKKIVISEEVNPPVVNSDNTPLEIPKGLKRRQKKSEESTPITSLPKPSASIPPKEAVVELPSVEPEKKRKRKVPILGRFQTPQLGAMSSRLAKMITNPSERWNLAPYRKVAEELSTKGKDATVKTEAVKLLAIVTSLEQEKSELLWFEKSSRVTSMEGYEEEDADFIFLPKPSTVVPPELIDRRPELLLKKYSKLKPKPPKKGGKASPLFGQYENLSAVDRELLSGSTTDRPFIDISGFYPYAESLEGSQSFIPQPPPTLPIPSGIPRVAPKSSDIQPIQVDENVLAGETSMEAPQAKSLYRPRTPDDTLQAQIENLNRRYKYELFRQSEIRYMPSVTRDLEAKASKAKTKKELVKVIEDTIAVQTGNVQELVTKIANSSNTLGTTAQTRMLRAEGKESPDQELIDFYQEKIDEVKSIESKLGSHADQALKKLTSQVTKTATEAYEKSQKERAQTELKKRKVGEEKVLSKYKSQYEKVLKDELELIANRTAFEEAQKFIDTESARGVSKEDIMPEARRIYDATKKEVLSKTKIESKLDREEVLGRYELQSKQFSKFDFMSEVTQMPEFVNEARKFELEFRTGLFKSGKDILDYFQKMGQVVPEQLEKQLLKPTFSAQSGTVFGAGITGRNREKIAEELRAIFEAASGPQPYVPPTLQPKKTYADFVSERVSSGVLQSLAQMLTMTREERQQAKAKTPTPPPSTPTDSGSGGRGGSFDKSSLSFPGDDGGGGGFNFDSLGDIASRIGLLKIRMKMVGDAITAVTSIPKELLAITPEATTRQGVSVGQVGGAFAKGLKGATGAAGSAVGGLVGGSIGGAALGTLIGGPAGTLAGGAAGAALGGAVGKATGSLMGDPIPLLGEIAENTAKSVQAFSPQVLVERLDGQISMLKLNIDTANKYGSELAELQMYANTARQEMYKLGVEFLIEFKPFFEDMLALIVWIVSGLRYLMSTLYMIFEIGTHIVTLFAPIRWAAEAANEWFKKGKRKKDLGDPVIEQMGLTGSFMLNRPFPGAKHQPLRERN